MSLAALFLMILAGMIFSLLVGYLVGLICWGKETVLAASTIAPGQFSPQTIGFMKTLQMINHAGTFLFPALFYRRIIGNPPEWQSYSPGRNQLLWLGIIFLLQFTLSPFINSLQELNQQFHLPEGLKTIEQWMQRMELRAAGLTDAFLKGTSTGGFLANILILAIIPALGEELVFRGIIQPGLSSIFRNKHLAIVVTALLFSAMHLQFYGFLPRFVLGLLFGYFFLWTQNLWTAIWAHFLNNGTAVVLAYLSDTHTVETDYSSFGKTTFPILIASSIISGILLMLLKNISAKRKENSVRQ